MSVFEYGCENEGLKLQKSSHFIFYGKSFDSETIDDEKSRAKQGFIIRIKGRSIAYKVITGRDIEIFLVRVCERVWTIELSIRGGHVSNVRSGN